MPARETEPDAGRADAQSERGAPRGTAVITGGSRGIGRALALRFAADGYAVGFCYRGDAEAAERTARDVEAAGRSCHTAALDVADHAAVSAFIEDCERALGPVTAAVASAGVTRDRSLALMSPQEWDTVLRTNLDGAFNLSRSVLPGMLRRRSGTVVFVSSVAALTGPAGQSNYAASKAGLHGLSRSLAKEVAGFGLRINVVVPGYIDTGMLATMSDAARARAGTSIPLGHLGTAEQVADAVSFLVSPQASYITGALLRVDGGLAC